MRRVPDIDHPAFPKIKRLSRGMTITEKIDGTNALIYIDDHGGVHPGSRNRWISPGKGTDNFGFARWVRENEEELRELGPGTHYGEWWGLGIQRSYGLNHKRFSLFNTGRWNQENTPDPCHIVPVLYNGDFNTSAVDNVLKSLHDFGSVARPGFDNPEGIVIYHAASRTLFKKTLDNNDSHKWMED